MRRVPPHGKIDLALDSRVSLRIYADCRPHVLQTARLQKGVIIVCDGTELVEEGLGLGVPVCRYRDGTRFSLAADTFVSKSAIVKVYRMNGMSSKRFRGVQIRRGGFLLLLLKLLERGYRELRGFNIGTNLILGLLSMLGMRNEFAESGSKGHITVTYRPAGKGLQIKVTFDELSQDGLESVVIANEQGGGFFGEYIDSTGLRLPSERVEPWRTTNAQWARMYSGQPTLGFEICRPSGWLIARGREVVRNRISWSGLDLLSNGTPRTLEYLVEFVEENVH